MKIMYRVLRPDVDKFWCLILKPLQREVKIIHLFTLLDSSFYTLTYILLSRVFLNINFGMSSVASTIQELFESGQSRVKCASFWRVVRVDLVFTRLWSASERQFRASLRLGTLQIARLGLLSSSKSPERKWGGILKEASGNWHQRLVWAWNDADSAHKWSEPFPIQKDKSLPTVRGHKTKRQQGTKLHLEKLRDGKQPPVLWTDEKLFKGVVNLWTNFFPRVD